MTTNIKTKRSHVLLSAWILCITHSAIAGTGLGNSDGGLISPNDIQTEPAIELQTPVQIETLECSVLMNEKSEIDASNDGKHFYRASTGSKSAGFNDIQSALVYLAKNADLGYRCKKSSVTYNYADMLPSKVKFEYPSTYYLEHIKTHLAPNCVFLKFLRIKIGEKVWYKLPNLSDSTYKDIHCCPVCFIG
ncbi:MAG: hypothetical protein AABZ06_04500 [Bdellovibrionota bacterium]